MNDIQVLSTTRNIIETAIHECKRHEFKVQYILQQYRAKLSNLMKMIQDDKGKNRKVQNRQMQIVQAACIYSTCATPGVLLSALMVKKSLLPSSIDVLQKSKK